MKREMLKQNKGITLVALVVTIVVLIILAGVSINLVLGENGIITKAQEARTKTEQTTLNEQIALNEIVEYMNGEGGNKPNLPPVAGTEVTKPDNWTSTQVKPVADGEGGVIPLPNGFYYVGGDIKTGFVISDNGNDENKGTSYETILEGNQFVWIPVKSEENLKRTNFDSDGKPITGLSSDYVEPYESGYVEETTKFNTMKTQVLKYEGFYIGRYEAGDGNNGTTFRTETTTAHTVVVKKGIAPYNYIPWGAAMNDASEVIGQSGAVYLSEKMYENSNSIVSTLCYGSQWDAMCRYIGDSQRSISKTSILQLTGNNSTDVSKNIYDLAGNSMEWTMEVNNPIEVRIARGNDYNHNDKINYRFGSGVDNYAPYTAFRPTLYIK